MAPETIIYRTKTAGEDEIFSHLTACDDSFQPFLSERVNIQQYSEKIFKHAVTFEAWKNNHLAGMIAAYFNEEKKSAYITSVSVVKACMGSGIASKLLDMCIQYALQRSYSEIGLEVYKNNIPAVNFYRKFRFVQTGTQGDSVIMNMLLK